MDAQRCGRCESFFTSTHHQLFGGGDTLGEFTVVAVGGYDENDAMSFCRCTSDGAAGADAFVIGVGMKANESGHPLCLLRGAAGDERIDVLHAPCGEHFFGVLTRMCWWLFHGGNGA